MYKLFKLKFLALLVVSIFMLNLNIYALPDFESEAGSAVLMEASTGRILYEKNANIAKPPASITKLMTLLLGFEAIEEGVAKWDDLVPISEKAWRMGGSRMFLEVGREVAYGDIITGISVVSGNDACVALAEYLYGSEAAFVQVMNQRAKEIGLNKTKFVNTTGLPDKGHEMSATDIAVLARYIIETHPMILELESQREFTFNDIHQYNRNPLLGVFPGADGLKTGWTEAAGYCLVGTAEQDGIRMISVVLNTEDENERLIASQELLNYGFRNFEIVNVINEGDIVDSMEIKSGKALEVPVKVNESLSVLVPTVRKNDIKVITEKDTDYLNAPLDANTSVGKLEVQLDGETLAYSGISTAEDVERAGFFELFFRSVANFFRSLFKV